MKYYSEILRKTYDTEVECTEAEKAYEEAKRAEEEAKAASETKISKRKKELAAEVEKASEKLKETEEALEAAENEVKILTEEYSKKIADILKPAKEAVTEATKSRYDAIRNFNKEFGPYTTVLSSSDAYERVHKNSLYDFVNFLKYFNF